MIRKYRVAQIRKKNWAVKCPNANRSSVLVFEATGIFYFRLNFFRVSTFQAAPNIFFDISCLSNHHLIFFTGFSSNFHHGEQLKRFGHRQALCFLKQSL